MQIIIDNFKCPSWNTLYSSKHWTVRKKMADEIHQLVFYSVKQQIKNIKPFEKKVKIIFEIHYKDNRRHDPDNAAIKLILDGLVLAGLLKDDSTKEIKEISIRMKKGQLQNKIIINIK